MLLISQLRETRPIYNINRGDVVAVCAGVVLTNRSARREQRVECDGLLLAPFDLALRPTDVVLAAFSADSGWRRVSAAPRETSAMTPQGVAQPAEF